jgi:hypothetical protein
MAYDQSKEDYRMGILVEWDNESHTAIRLVYGNTWNWRDHFLALDAASSLMASVQHPVDLILDLRNSMPLPESTTWNVTQSGTRLHEHWSGRTIILSPDDELARVMLDAMSVQAEQDGLLTLPI